MVAEKKGQRDTRRVENESVSVILPYCCHPHTEYRIRHARRLVSHKLRANISSAIECLALAEATGACQWHASQNRRLVQIQPTSPTGPSTQKEIGLTIMFRSLAPKLANHIMLRRFW